MTWQATQPSLTLDGSYGEGGGQILRTALALAAALGRPVRLTRIRAARPRPGLQPQHLTVVRALADVSDAEVRGGDLDSTDVEFVPRGVRAGEYQFDIAAIRGSAGSVSLLFQSLLLTLALAGAPSRLTLLGGTHVPWSPPVHYLTEVFLPALREIGLAADVSLRRWGWYPAGGGEIEAVITPAARLGGFNPEPRASAPALLGLSAVSLLPRSIAERQRRRAEERLLAAGLTAAIAIEEDLTARSPGTLLFLGARGRAGFSALGRRGLPAERVADLAIEPLLDWVSSGAAIGDHLADQLMPFLALAAAPSAFTCRSLSRHLRTVAWVVQQFLPARITLVEEPARVDIVPALA